MYICALRTSAYKINIKEWNMQEKQRKKLLYRLLSTRKTYNFFAN